jgi:hypothetical protein
LNHAKARANDAIRVQFQNDSTAMNHLRRAFYSVLYCTVIFAPPEWLRRYLSSIPPDRGESISPLALTLLLCCSIAWIVFAAYAARPICSAYLCLEPTQNLRHQESPSVTEKQGSSHPPRIDHSSIPPVTPQPSDTLPEQPYSQPPQSDP